MSGSLPVVFIMGPTASGKTGLATELLDRLDADIVSVDSAMIYRGLDIGTAKPTREELERAPHALIDILDPAESWSAGEFCEAAVDEIQRSHNRGRIPLLTGGTMMYFRSLEHGLNDLPVADDAVRRDIDARASEVGWPALHAELERCDPEAAHRIHKNDSQRIQRALEVYRLTGTPLSELQSQRSRPLDYPLIKFALGMDDRAELHSRIGMRFEQMMDSGFLDEVRGLFERGDLHRDLPSIRSVGYRQLWAHLEGEVSLAKASDNVKTATRQLAKRQLTWLRSDDRLTNLPLGEPGNIERAASQILSALDSVR